MNDEKNILHDDAEPTVGRGAVFLPMWIAGLLALMIYLGFNYVSAHGDYQESVYEPYHSTNQLAGFVPTDETTTAMALGKRMYEKNCSICHQPTGAGVPGQFPPLVGSDWVLAPGPNRIIRLPLLGISGPVKVNGTEFNGTMPPLAAAGGMSDEEVAAVMTFIRNSWGNKASGVTVEQVQKVRAELKDRTASLTGDEAMKIPDKP
jgi:mono/diheme cytochrome c family protein